MFRTLTLSLGLLLCSASARSLSQAELQQVAQEMLTLPQDDQTVQQARPFALTWLGDAAGVEAEGQNAGGDASMLARLAIRTGHPELLPIFLKGHSQPQTVVVWSAVLASLIASGQFEEADWVLRQAGPQQRVNLIAQMGISVTGRELNVTDEQRRWAMKWLGEISNSDLQKLAPAEQSRIRGLLAASYVRLGDVPRATQVMQAEPLFVKNQLWHQMAFESVMARQPERARVLTAMIKPVSATEQRMLAGLVAEQATSLSDVPQLRHLLASMRTPGNPMSAREVDATVMGMMMRQVERGGDEMALWLLGQIEDSQASVVATSHFVVAAARQGNHNLARRLAQRALNGFRQRSDPQPNTVWNMAEALGAAGLVEDGLRVSHEQAKMDGLRGYLVKGLIAGNMLPEAKQQAASLRQSEDLRAVMQGVLILAQRQRTADVRDFLTLMRPAMQAQQDSSPNSARSLYLRLLAQYGGDQVFREVRPGDELGAIRFAAAESGNLKVIEALLKPGESLQQEIESGAAALALVQNGYAEEALALFRKTNAPNVKALIGVSLLQGEARSKP
ncbi:hypothetical protein [Deinococcus cavernae]|nr:hypothetical protein [Deinococcus cavernae]